MGGVFENEIKLFTVRIHECFPDDFVLFKNKLVVNHVGKLEEKTLFLIISFLKTARCAVQAYYTTNDTKENAL